VAVATNGSHSYAIFNYLDDGIQWSSADNTGGINGIGPFGTQVGFNGGDGVHFFVRPEPQSDSILKLDDNSNICERGKYVFRIDGDIAQPGRCINIKTGYHIHTYIHTYIIYIYPKEAIHQRKVLDDNYKITGLSLYCIRQIIRGEKLSRFITKA